MLMIEFAALGCYEVFGIKGSDTLNRSPSLASMSTDGAEFEQALHANSTELRVDDIATRFHRLFAGLEKNASTPNAVPDYLVTALNKIETQDGAVKITELCDRIRVSRRQFTRKFTELIGVPPKYFCRVIQMNKAMEALMSENAGMISDIANNAGYFDEAHLIHTVQEFFGLPVKAVAASEHPAVLKMHASSRKV